MPNTTPAPYKIGDRVLINVSFNSSHVLNGKTGIITAVKAGTTNQYQLKNNINGKPILNNAWLVQNYLTLKTPAVVKTASVKPVAVPKDISLHTILGQETAKRQIKVAIANNLPVLLVGDTGTGKTTIVKDLAIKANQSYIRFNLTGETTVEEFVGKYTLENGRTIWQDGILLTAMKNGDWLIVDEVNVALPEILFVLHSLLDDERAVLVANHDGEVVKPSDSFRFFATMNPVDEYAGTKDLNKAFKSRFGMIINLDYPVPKTEAVILQSKGGVDSDTASKLVDIAVSIRKSKEAGQIFYTCSTRDLLQVCTLVKPLGLNQAIKLAIVNKANGDGKAIEALIKQVNASYAEAEAIAGTTNLEAIEQKIAEFKVKDREYSVKLKDLEYFEHQANERVKALEQKELDLTAKMLSKEKDLKAVIKKELIAELTGVK